MYRNRNGGLASLKAQGIVSRDCVVHAFLGRTRNTEPNECTIGAHRAVQIQFEGKAARIIGQMLFPVGNLEQAEGSQRRVHGKRSHGDLRGRGQPRRSNGGCALVSIVPYRYLRLGRTHHAK